MNRLLIVDVAEEKSRKFSRIASRLGYKTAIATTLGEFIVNLSEFAPSVVLIDLPSIGNGGIDCLKALRDQESSAHIVLTSSDNERELETAKQLAGFMGLTVVAYPRSSMFASAMRDELQRVRHLQTNLRSDDLRRALKKGDVCPYYQPRASCDKKQNGAILEVEVLPQWHIAENKSLLPEDFYWLAQNAGLMPQTINTVLRQVVEDMSMWQKRKIPLRVAVKLPAASLADQDLADFLFEIMRAAKLDTSLMTLEVSEADVMNFCATATENLGRLKTMGFKLAIDDFGTSFSSIEQLCRLKFDEITIDPSLVLESRSSSEARAIVEATVALGHKLGLSVCAEGVESRRTLNYVGKVGCNKAQGNFISGPLLASKLEDHIGQQRKSAAAC